MRRTGTRLQWSNSRGYTIVEVMIFLVVSGALMGSAMTMISGQEEKTRFSQSVRTFEQDIQDIFNDVSTGYYSASSPENVNFKCTPGASGSVSVTAGSSEQGSNQGCVFLGKIVQLTNGSDQYSVYTLINSRTAETIGDIKGRLLGTDATGGRGIVDSRENQADLVVAKIISKADITRTVTGLALISDFNVTTPNDGVTGNASRVTLYEYTGGYLNDEITSASLPSSAGVIVCLEQVGGPRASVVLDSRGIRSGETSVNPWSGDCN